ncbi:hypothetical protein [Bacteroides caccae]|jgi:hypothetical protein|uniref:hypothetical protein n=1 Tax=Bacteroides caccae TaxID=47678 RepID=UPI001230DB76|nr:hypothetical protein F2Y49_24730 [Bacteroides caccae]
MDGRADPRRHARGAFPENWKGNLNQPEISGLGEMACALLTKRFHHELSLRLIDAECPSGHSGAV